MTDKVVLLSDIEFVEMHSDDWERIERESFEIQEQPLLDPNQQIVLDLLKKQYTTIDIEPVELVWRLRVNSNKDGYRDLQVFKTFRYMTKQAQAVLLLQFSKWIIDLSEDK